MHRAYSQTRPFLVALPLLALLLLLSPSHAFACGHTASEVTYCTPLGLESGESIKHQEPKPSTTPRRTKPNPSQTEPEVATKTTEPEAEPHPAEGHRSHGAPPARGGNHPGGGNPSHQAAPQHHGDHVSPAKSVTSKPSEGPTTKAVPASASSGGSSPVLPILVAIVVLAGISIGFVVYRERRGGDGQAGYTGAGG